MSAATGPLYCADRAEVARVKRLMAGVAVGFVGGAALGVLAAVMQGII